MNHTDFSLSVQPEQARAARRWLFSAVLSLTLSGVYSLLVVLGRTPQANRLLPIEDVFHTALVIHVDLLVLFWFFSMAGMLWSLVSSPRFAMLDTAGWGCVTGSAILMALSPLSGGTPYMNNYIVVLYNPMFFLSLGLLSAGVTLTCLAALVPIPGSNIRIPLTAQHTALWSAALIVIIALLCFVISFPGSPVPGDDLQSYFEELFWSGGHILQFAWTLLMLAAWLWLASASFRDLRIPPAAIAVCYLLSLLACLPAPLIQHVYPIESADYYRFFTQHMIHAGGISALPVGLLLLWGIVRNPQRQPGSGIALAALLMSVLLFAMGGTFGHLIRGVNVVIPAHYHGQIIGVSLALMGVIYLLLPKLGYAAPRGKLPIWQLVLYGAGQLIHITGLAISGGYDVLRKTPGGHLAPEAKFWMGVMGGGGMIAIIGGLLFIWIVGRILISNKQYPSEGVILKGTFSFGVFLAVVIATMLLIGIISGAHYLLMARTS